MPAKKKEKIAKKTTAKQSAPADPVLEKLEHELPTAASSHSDQPAAKQDEQKPSDELPTLEVSQPPTTEPTNVINPPVQQNQPTSQPPTSESQVLPQFTPSEQIPASSGSKKSQLLLIVIFLLIITIGAGGFLFYKSQTKKQAKTDKKPASKTQSKVPSPTTPKLDLSQYKIKVLNGAGIAGEATKAKALLAEAGFNVEETGNADKYDYRETIIQTKKETPKEFVEKLKQALKDSYVSSPGATLTEGESVDAVIIVGSKKP